MAYDGVGEMGMARSYLARRPRPLGGEEAYSSRRRRRTHYSPMASSPMTPVQRRSPSYSRTSPSYSRTSPSYSPTSPPYPPAAYSQEAYYPRLPRLDDDDDDAIVGDEGPGPEDQDDENHHIHEEEEEEEHERSESDGGMEQDDEYFNGSDGGGNGVESDQQHDEDDEIGEDQSGENGVEDEQQADEERQEAPAAPQPQDVQDNVAAVEEDSDDDDRPLHVVSRARTSTAAASAPPEPPPAPAAPQESSPLAPSSFSDERSSVIRNVTVENSSAFDCSICYLPLKSPIFQCTVGHVVCSPCHDKLGQATSCHVCRIPIPGGYSRCNAMEQLVDSIRVPCPHAAHGCAERMAYHDRASHARTCAHRPCHCPGEGCGFASPVLETLLEHFTAVHGWPCSGESTTGTSNFLFRLRKGFNVVTASGRSQGGAWTEEQYTLVLKVEQVAPVCNTITVFCIHPRNTTGTVVLDLSYYRRCPNSVRRSTYIQSAELNVDGMPGPSTYFPFIVPSWPAPATQGEDEIDIRVRRPPVE